MKRVLQIVVATAFVALLGLTVYIMVCNMQGKVANVFGRSVMKVISGSMEPLLHEGDYITTKSVNTNTLKVGDIISFYSTDKDIYGKVNTHRIVKINSDKTFSTQGDANSTEDRVTVSAKSVIGVYTGKVRFLRWVNSFASGRKLLMVLVIVPMLLVSVYEVVTLTKIRLYNKAESEKAEAEEKEKLIKEAVEKEKQRLYEEHISVEDLKKSDDEKTD